MTGPKVGASPSTQSAYVVADFLRNAAAPLRASRHWLAHRQHHGLDEAVPPLDTPHLHANVTSTPAARPAGDSCAAAPRRPNATAESSGPLPVSTTSERDRSAPSLAIAAKTTVELAGRWSLSSPTAMSHKITISPTNFPVLTRQDSAIPPLSHKAARPAVLAAPGSSWPGRGDRPAGRRAEVAALN